MDSMVVGAALSAFFQHLLDTVGPPVLKSLVVPFGVEKEAKRLKLTHSRIEALLTDAEERQIKEESVRLWLSDLKHVAYDAEDIFDELEYRALQSKIEEAPSQTRKRKLIDRFRVTHLFSRYSSNFNFGSRIKEIRERWDEMERESNQFHFLLRVIHHGSRSEMLRMPPPTSSIVDESSVFGREADREKVVRLLASDDSSASDSGIQVVPICGMGGVGKTTLAQLIHNDERVKKHFDVSAWVYVSEDFDLIRLTKAIAESVLRGSDPRLTSLDAIQVSIQKALQGKKIFLVLDDVWNVNCNRWDALRAPLTVAGRGSRILVTTRSHRVSSMMGTVPTYSLQCLSEDDCWSLFKRLAFVEADSDVHPDLVKIGKEIVNKCKGLPLAVKTLGGLLRSKVNVVEWKSILESEIWDLPVEGNDILPALRLSYHHLPSHLKRCFAYCCVFNKGTDFINGEELVRSWMALGFIQSEGSKDMEDIGKEYLADLISRSLLYYDEDVLFLGMHDLIHDLAQSVSGAEILEIIGDSESQHKNAEKVRHVSCALFGSSVESVNFEYLYCFKGLRTLRLHVYAYGSVLTIPPDLFVNLRRIRVLDLNDSDITELPESIGNLIQLRYLNLSWSKIERLPKSIGNLIQLRYLELSRTTIERLPKSIGNLIQLRYLDLSDTMIERLPESIGNLIQLRYLDLSRTTIERLPKSITRLDNLQTLDLAFCSKLVEVPSDFSNLVNLRNIILWGCSASIPFGGLKCLQHSQHLKVGREIGYRVNELRVMKFLRGSLCISKLENVVSVEEAKEAELKNKQNINRLELEWESHDVDSRQEGIEEEVLNALQPHTNLERLTIKGYCGIRFPTWLGDSSFSKLVSICLSGCKCRILPPFGQLPSLEYLYLQNLYGLEKVGREFYGDGMVKGFPSLKRLEISDSPDLEEWTALEGDMIHVREIWIRRCSKLRVLPDIFPLTLDSLEIYDCPLLTSLGDEVLPATLHDLAFSYCDNLNRLPTGLKNLTSLADLQLDSCPKIHFLPEELPTSTLDRLIIRRCPLVTEKCKEGGEYWSKISHIPHIKIDYLVQKYAGEVMR